MPASMRRQGSLENKPTDASATTHQLSTDQFVILATDGFFDNVFLQDAASHVAQYVSSSSSNQQAQDLAQRLTEMAKSAGRSRKNGPFAAEAKAHRLRFDGGKEDDICLIVLSLQANSIDAKAKL